VVRLERSSPRAGHSRARPGSVRCADLHTVPQRQDAGILDPRAEVAGLDSHDLASQAAFLIDLPSGMRHLAASRLYEVLAELQDRVARVEVAP
jgi:hypothetical protein